jgi:hypothetical protein
VKARFDRMHRRRSSIEYGDRCSSIHHCRSQHRCSSKLYSCSETPLKTVAIIMLDAGLRPDECFRLRWENVRFIYDRRRCLNRPWHQEPRSCPRGTDDSAFACYYYGYPLERDRQANERMGIPCEACERW